jgi:hypothetical protein
MQLQALGKELANHICTFACDPMFFFLLLLLQLEEFIIQRYTSTYMENIFFPFSLLFPNP